MCRVAQFVVQTQVETVGGRFVALDLANEFADPEFRRRSAYGKGVDRLPTRFQIFNTRENDLGSWKLVKPLFQHDSSLEGRLDFDGSQPQAGPAEVGSPKSSTSVSTLPDGIPTRETTKAIAIATAIP